MILRKITACVSYCITKVFRFFYFDGNFVLFVAILSSKTLETRRKYFRIEDRNKINLPRQERERERDYERQKFEKKRLIKVRSQF